MRLDFKDEVLRRLYADATFHHPRFARELVRQYRKVVGLIDKAESAQDLRALRSLRFEQLQGKRSGQCSLRLNRQWRLIVEVVEEEDEDPLVRVLEIVDYH